VAWRVVISGLGALAVLIVEGERLGVPPLDFARRHARENIR